MHDVEKKDKTTDVKCNYNKIKKKPQRFFFLFLFFFNDVCMREENQNLKGIN